MARSLLQFVDQRNVFCLGRSTNPVKFAKFAIISNGFVEKKVG